MEASAEAYRLEDLPVGRDTPDGSSFIWLVARPSTIVKTLLNLYPRFDQMTRILVFYLDVEDFMRVEKMREVQALLSHPSCRFFHIPVNQPFDFDSYREKFSPRAGENLQDTAILADMEFIERGGENLYKQFDFAHSQMSMTLGRSASSGWIVKDNLMGFRNFLGNFPNILGAPDIGPWSRLGKGRSAVIVGAGPSVENQLDWLKANRSSLVILAADTMLNPLLKAGIDPDLVCSLERTRPVVDLLKKAKASESQLCGASVLDPDCFSDFENNYRVFYLGVDYENFITLKRNRMSTGHSCVGVAMALCSLMEFSKIFLMGIDLCWSASGSSHMKSVEYLSKEFYQTQNQKLLRNSIEYVNHRGEPVRTQRYWMLFRQQFQGWAGLMRERLQTQVINLSPSGLELKGANFMELDSARRELISSSAESFVKLLKSKASPVYPRPRLQDLFGGMERRCLAVESDLSSLHSVSDRAEFFNRMKASSHYRDLLFPIFFSEVEAFSQDKEGTDIAHLQVAVNDLLNLLKAWRAQLSSLQAEFANRRTAYFG